MPSWNENLSGTLKLFRRDSIFVRLMVLINVLIVLCVTVLGMLVYSICNRRIMEVVNDTNLQLTRQAQSEVENHLAKLDRMTFQLAMESNLKTATYSSLNNNYFQLACQKSIASISNLDEEGENLWIYLSKTNTVLNRDSKYSTSLFFTKINPYSNTPELSAVSQSHPQFLYWGQQMKEDDIGQKALCFARSIPIDSNIPTGMIVLSLSSDQLRQSLGNPQEAPYSSYYVLDSGGNILISSPSDFSPSESEVQQLWSKINRDISEGCQISESNNTDYLTTYCVSRDYQWTYLAVTPLSFIYQSSANIKTTTIVILVIALILSLTLSYLLTIRLYQPICSIVALIRSLSDKNTRSDLEISGNELSFIQQIINSAYRENHLLHVLYEKNKPFLQDNLLNSLISGKLSAQDATERCEELGISMSGAQYLTVVLELDLYGTQHFSRRQSGQIESSLNQLALEQGKELFSCHTFPKDYKTFVGLFCFFQDSRGFQEMDSLLRKMQDILQNAFGTVVSVGVGGCYSSITQFNMSFIDALAALKHCEIRGKGSVIYIDEVKTLPGPSFIYAIGTEQQLINLIKIGDISRQRALTEQIIAENLSETQATPERIQNLFYALIGTAVRTIYEIRSTTEQIFPEQPDLYKALSDKQDIEQKKEVVLSIFKEVSDYIQQQNQNQSQQLMQKIDFLIRQSNGNITLAETADTLGISYTYLSSIFKEISGEGFVGYVNSYRVRYAQELLANRSLSIAEIASITGFGSANTFIKVYKKYYGVTPGKYRETL